MQSDIWRFDDLDPDFVILVTPAVDRGGQVRITGLTLEPKGTGGDEEPNVTGPVLRRISIGTIRRHIRRQLEGTEYRSGPKPTPQHLALAAMRVSTQAGRQVGQHRTDLEWAEIAELYVSLCNSGESHITEQMARALAVSKGYVPKLVYRATQHGMLEDRQPGLAGGRLTTKALGLLSDRPDPLRTPPVQVRRVGNGSVKPGRLRG